MPHRMRLFTTRTSHFGRKVLIAMRELQLDFEIELVDRILDADPARFGGSPLMQVPALRDGDELILDSDTIVRHLVRTKNVGDRLRVGEMNVGRARQLAVLNGIMAHEATLLLATDMRRDAPGGEAEPTGPSAYFAKIRLAVGQALSWFEQQVDGTRQDFDYIDVATLSMWEHHVRFALVPDTYDFPRIAARVARFADRPSVRQNQ